MDMDPGVFCVRAAVAQAVTKEGRNDANANLVREQTSEVHVTEAEVRST